MIVYAYCPLCGLFCRGAANPSAASTPSEASAAATDGSSALGCAAPRRASAACNGTATASVPASSSTSYAACR